MEYASGGDLHQVPHPSISITNLFKDDKEVKAKEKALLRKGYLALRMRSVQIS
jgi:hypothetical protein